MSYESFHFFFFQFPFDLRSVPQASRSLTALLSDQWLSGAKSLLRSRCRRVQIGTIKFIVEQKNQHRHLSFLFNRYLFLLTFKHRRTPSAPTKNPFYTMPPKKTVAADAGKNPPHATAKRQRTLTNKQQQLGKISFNLRAQLICGLLVTQRNEKEESAKQRAFTNAVRSEQHQEEINGFHKRKPPGNVYLLPVFLISNLLLKYPTQTMMILSPSQKTTMMNCKR